MFSPRDATRATRSTWNLTAPAGRPLFEVSQIPIHSCITNNYHSSVIRHSSYATGSHPEPHAMQPASIFNTTGSIIPRDNRARGELCLGIPQHMRRKLECFLANSYTVLLLGHSSYPTRKPFLLRETWHASIPPSRNGPPRSSTLTTGGDTSLRRQGRGDSVRTSHSTENNHRAARQIPEPDPGSSVNPGHLPLLSAVALGEDRGRAAASCGWPRRWPRQLSTKLPAETLQDAHVSLSALSPDSAAAAGCSFYLR